MDAFFAGFLHVRQRGRNAARKGRRPASAPEQYSGYHGTQLQPETHDHAKD